MNKALKIILISAACLAGATAAAAVAYHFDSGVQSWVGVASQQSSSASQTISVSAAVDDGYEFPAKSGTVKQAVFTVAPAGTADKKIVVGGWDGQYQDIRFVDGAGNYLDGAGMPTYQSGETAYLRLDSVFSGNRVLEIWPEANAAATVELTFTCAAA